MDQGKLWEVAGERFSIEQLRQNQDLFFEKEILDDLGIDIVLRGSFTEYRGKLRFEAKLEDRRNKTSVGISSKPVSIRDIYAAVEQFSKELEAELLLVAQGKSKKQLAIGCFQDKSMASSDMSRKIKEGLPISLLSSLQLPEAIRLLPWNITKKFCEKGENQTYNAIMDGTKADAVLWGQFVVEKSQIEIDIFLSVRGETAPVQVVAIENQFDDYYALADDLAQNVNDIVPAIIDREGRWQTGALQLAGEDPVLNFERGKAVLNENIPLAIFLFKNAIRLKSDYPEAHYQLGLALRRQNRYRASLVEFNVVLDLVKKKNNPGLEALAHEGIGISHFEQNEYDQALDALHRAARIDPGLDRIFFRIGEIYFLTGEYNKANDEFEKALEKAPKDPAIYNMQGRAYLSLGYFDKAMASFRSAIRLDASNSEAKANITQIYNEKSYGLLKKREPTAALNVLDEAVRLDYVNNDTYYYKGYAHADLDQNDEAIRAFSQAIKLNPADKTSFLSRGVIYSKLGKQKNDNDGYVKAVEDYSNAISLDPKYTLAYYDRGLIY